MSFLQVRLQLRTQLTSLRPVELVWGRGEISTSTARLMKNALHSPAVNEVAALTAGGEPGAAAKVGRGGGCWTSNGLWHKLRREE